MEVFKNMALLAELVQCGGLIFTWCYNENGTLLHSNCPDQAFLSGVFDLFGCKQQMMEYGTDHDPPLPSEPHWESCGRPPLRRRTDV